MKRYYILTLAIVMTSFLPSTALAQLDENVVYERIMQRKNMDGYREGTPWNNSNIYVNTVEYAGYLPGYFTGTACYAFMMDMMEYASNYEYPIYIVGDGVRVNNNSHSVVVIETNGSVITVAEGNYNSTVHWGRKIDLANPNNGFTWVATFWPEESTSIAYNSFNGNARDVLITNISGVLVKEATNSNLPIRILLNGLPKGTYIVKEGTKTYKVFVGRN